MVALEPEPRESTAVRLLRELERHLGDAAGLQSWQGSSGLEHSQYAILDVLRRDGPRTTTDLAEALHLDTSTVSRQVQAAERRGLVDRQSSPTDRRASVLSVTTHGETLLDEAIVARNALVEETLAGWSTDEQRILLEQITRLATACQERWRP